MFKITSTERQFILKHRKVTALAEKAALVSIRTLADQLETKINNKNINTIYNLLKRTAQTTKNNEVIKMVESIRNNAEQGRIMIYKLINLTD